MKKNLGVILTGLTLLAVVLEGNSSDAATTAPAKPPTIETAYPGLSSGSLSWATLGKLPDDVLVQAGKVQITAQELQKIVACASEKMREQYQKNQFFLLEKETTDRILLVTARRELDRAKTACGDLTDQEIIENFIAETVTKGIQVSDAEVTEYYRKNKGMCGEATFDEAKAELKEYALKEKQQKAVNDYIRTLGKRVPIAVSAPWVREQAKLALDNPVDQARRSGKVSVVDFGATGCRPCDMMTPVLKNLKEKYTGKVNVLFIHVRQERILAERYGVEAIPIQVFFDKTGKEVYRHLGFFPQEEIETKLTEMGIK